MNKKLTWVVVAIIIVGGYYVLQSKPEPATGEPITVGFMGALSGDAATLGVSIRAAVELARDEINIAGGVGGRPIELVFEDSQCDAKAATNAATKLMTIDNVVAVIGGLCSSETLAAAPLANSNQVPLISYSSTNPKITDAGDYVFRFIPSDTFQGKFAAEHVVNTLQKKNVAILYCLSDWCVGIKDVFKSRLAELSGTVVSEEGYAQDSRDLRSQITKIKAANPEVVYFLGYTEASIVGLKQLKELGVTAPIFGGDAWDDPKIPEGAGVAANGAQFSTAGGKELSQAFIDEVKSRSGGVELNTYTARGYDILMVLTQIMRKVGTDSVAIKDALYGVKNYNGVADTYTLDANGDITTAMYIIREYQDGKIITVEE